MQSAGTQAAIDALKDPLAITPPTTVNVYERPAYYLPPTPDPVWRCRKCHGLIYSSQRFGRRHPLRLTPPPRFYAKSIFGQALPTEYDVTPMLKAQRRKRRDSFAETSAAMDVLFQEFERNVYGIPVKRVA